MTVKLMRSGCQIFEAQITHCTLEHWNLDKASVQLTINVSENRVYFGVAGNFIQVVTKMLNEVCPFQRSIRNMA